MPYTVGAATVKPESGAALSSLPVVSIRIPGAKFTVFAFSFL
jgi:hypothetical protein